MKIVVDRNFEGAQAGIAAALIALESQFEASRPDAVVVADDSDAALAAAVVAAKLLIALEATPEARADSPTGRVLAQLAAPAA
jgi:UDP-N-acetylglucosamine 2-epimerase